LAAAPVVYIADSGNDRVQRFSPDGQPLGAWGATGSRPGQFAHPRGIAVDLAGRVYVADPGNDSDQVFAPEGEPLQSWPSEQPVGIAVDRQGFTYVTCGCAAGGLKEYSPGGDLVTKWGGEGAASDPFAPKPRGGVAVDIDGNVYVVDADPSTGAGGVWYWSRAEALCVYIW
jgi:sugar lactone lactonase YvrE